MSMRTPAKRGGGREESEVAFLAAYDPTKFERPSLAVDVVLLSALEGALYTLLVKREEHPHKGRWALPGGFVRMTEALDAAAARVLEAKTGLVRVFLEQLYTFGDPRRDPRMRVVSVAYYALVERRRFDAVRAQGELRVARVVVPWTGEAGGPIELQGEDRTPLSAAFDHAEVIGAAVKRIRGKLDYAPIGYQLLPREFTLFELQGAHETVLGRPLNKDSFRRRMLASGDLEATGESQKDVDHRPAELYRFAGRSQR
jgi:ADP-ribose pyrophosphatase YjhB (NUDIX family)